MRISKNEEQCQLCDTKEKLNLVDLKYRKFRLCNSCVKWFAVFCYNTVNRYRQVLGLTDL